MHFRDMTVLITGAGQGMGRSHALAFARQGANVVVNDVPGSDGDGLAEAVADEIRGEGGQAVAAPAAVGDAESARFLIDTAIEEFGRIDVVVSNAGILRDRTLAKMSVSDWDDVTRVHLAGGFHLARAAWPHLVEQRFGRLVMITSVSGLYGQFGQANYSAAKMGLVGLVKTLALEGAKYGIHTNALSPLGSTSMNAHVLSEEEKQRYSHDYVSRAIQFLATRECDLNGSILHAGAGYYTNVVVAHTEGVRFDSVPTLAELADAWPRISGGTLVREPIDL
jgi:NAD(P)-dependent dehydrogenase (short-subunit alcohol dehydrogenase family)